MLQQKTFCVFLAAFDMKRAEKKRVKVNAALDQDFSLWMCRSDALWQTWSLLKNLFIPAGQGTLQNPLGGAGGRGSSWSAMFAGPACCLNLNELPKVSRKMDFCQVAQMHRSVLYWHGVLLTSTAKDTVQSTLTKLKPSHIFHVNCQFTLASSVVCHLSAARFCFACVFE